MVGTPLQKKYKYIEKKHCKNLTSKINNSDVQKHIATLVNEVSHL